MAGSLGLATANISDVVELAVNTTLYLKAVKHGSADRLRLRDELRSTTCLLQMLQDRLDDSGDQTADDSESLSTISLQALVESDGPLILFQNVLADINKKLALPKNALQRLSKPLTWPFDKKDIAELLDTIERLKSYFTLILQNDTVELIKLSNAKLDNLLEKSDRSEGKERDEEFLKIVQWISPLSFHKRQVDVLETVQPGTGSWLLEHTSFQRWLSSDIDTLWCPGIPGAGKTRLISLIVDYLGQHKRSPSEAYTYVYCDYGHRQEQTPSALLSSLLQQLLQQSTDNNVPSEISSLYQLHQKYDTRPSIMQIIDALRRVTERLKNIYVVIDALDECAESEDDILEFLSSVRQLGTNIRLLCTSRFSNTFEEFFAGSEKVEIYAQSQDIAMYLDAQLQKQRRLSKHIRSDPNLKEEIISTIIQQSQGMFLLPKLHLESLSRKINRKDVRASLRTLPTTLDATYDDALQRINKQDEDSAALAEFVIFVTACVQRPITLLEIQQMYAIQELLEDTSLEEDDLPDADILTTVCGGLITTDEESKTLRLVHYTIQQYIERSHLAKLMEMRMTVATTCMRYLVLDNFSEGVCSSDSAMAQRLERYPFLDYAAKHWGADVNSLDGDSLLPLITSFLSDATALQVANQASAIRSMAHIHWSQEYPRDVPPLVAAAAFNLPSVLRTMLGDGSDIEGHGSDSETALIRASNFGCAENVRILLELGANVNARDHMNETAVQKAAAGGFEEAVKALLDGSADVNVKASSDWTVLMSAVAGGNLNIVRMLVKAGAKLPDETVWGDSALSIATRNGREDIATFLADSGVILPHGPAGRRASLVASKRGLENLVRRLTADYEAIAAKPLQRQGSKIMGGLEKIAEDHDETTSTENNNDDLFLEFMEDIEYKVGFERRYELKSVLGKGHSAIVKTAANKVTNTVHAVKIFKLSKPSIKSSVEDELRLLRELRLSPHPNVIALVDVFAEYAEKQVYVVLELMRGGELFNYIIVRVKLSQDQTRTIMSQIFSALDFLHERGWMHRDIKPENILLADVDSLSVKLVDFGISKKLGDAGSEMTLTTTLCGTPSYVAPEILATSDTRQYNHLVDIWSTGVVLYICLCGFPPFSDELFSKEYPYSLSQQISSGRFDYPSPYWDSIPDSALDLIDSMLIVEPQRRFTAKQCAEHAWMRDTTTPIVSDIVRSASPENI